MSYRIKSVTELTGIPAETLRAWERRYHIVSPRRSGGGYRIYSDEDVALLARVRALVDGGLKVSEAVVRVRAGEPAPVGGAPPAIPVTETREELLVALLALDRTAATRATDTLALLPFDQRLDAVLLPVLREIGARWARGEASVVQEHFASAFVREKLAGILDSLDAGPASGPHAVCVGAPGEQHELGLLAVAVHLALRGWRITYLGADLPPAELAGLLQARPPVLLCTSILFPRGAAECLAYAGELRAIAPPETRIVLGGAGIPAEAVGSPAPGLHLVRGLDELFLLLARDRE